MKNEYIGWMVTILGVMFTTMGHYFELWYCLYIFCGICGVVTAIVLEE